MGPQMDIDKFQVIQLKGGNDAPLGCGPPTAIRLSRTLADWSKDPSNERAWKEMIDESNGEL